MWLAKKFLFVIRLVWAASDIATKSGFFVSLVNVREARKVSSMECRRGWIKIIHLNPTGPDIISTIPNQALDLKAALIQPPYR